MLQLQTCLASKVTPPNQSTTQLEDKNKGAFQDSNKDSASLNKYGTSRKPRSGSEGEGALIKKSASSLCFSNIAIYSEEEGRAIFASEN
jgi:hypothetical protein